MTMRPWLLPALALSAMQVWAQSETLTQGPHQMQISVERLDHGAWKTVDPRFVFAQKDRVRFRYHTNFEGYLYVMNWSTSGKYQQLFPTDESSSSNRVAAGTEYTIPSAQSAFRISGPAGYEKIYWLVNPAELKSTGA